MVASIESFFADIVEELKYVAAQSGLDSVPLFVFLVDVSASHGLLSELNSVLMLSVHVVVSVDLLVHFFRKSNLHRNCQERPVCCS